MSINKSRNPDTHPRPKQIHASRTQVFVYYEFGNTLCCFVDSLALGSMPRSAPTFCSRCAGSYFTACGWPLCAARKRAGPVSGEQRGGRDAVRHTFAVVEFVTSRGPTDRQRGDGESASKLRKVSVKAHQNVILHIIVDDIREVENILRNKYCGPQGAFSGEPGGTCAESPQIEATCFKATGFAPSCTKSYDK